jgi:bifunctional DNA-binding transcriptional regulator/antitoxin component of YhaV-PrlF toxin-antitoxin module
MRIVRETNNQVVVNIPASIRDALKLEKGDVLAFVIIKDGVVGMVKVEAGSLLDIFKKEVE